VKAAYESHGILVFADESVSTAADIEKLWTIIHGINVKLEKAGGIRGALQVVTAAKVHKLKVCAQRTSTIPQLNL
jgi:L-alanine-DL-glutamate epimerase-like enolase superfamily enzyme